MREDHAGEGVLGEVTLRDGDRERLLARLTHRIMDFSKHTFEGAEERLLSVSGLSRRTHHIWCLLIELLSPNLWVTATINQN